MHTRHDELRDELVAILGAGRELSADSDRQLADAFVHYLEQEPERVSENVVPAEAPHQPHYSLKIAGGAWGAALMFLFLLLLLDNPSPGVFLVTAVVILSIVAVLTRGFLYMARHDWRMPRVRITVAPPKRHTPR
ncbi:MAG TPA: hypothetical protein VF221_07085 [Chloroflexota bacterium]